ncbi:MAG: transglycosylase SLT domain-containing protein [Hyphomicrobiales bacterium]
MLAKRNFKVVTAAGALLAIIAGIAGIVMSLSGSDGDHSLASAIGQQNPTVEIVPPPPDRSAAPELADPRQALREGRFEDASRGFAALAQAQADPGLKAEAELGAGVADFEAGNRDAALQHLRAAAEHAPANSATSRRATYLLGLRLNESGDHERAAEALGPVAEQPVMDPLEPYILSEYARALGNSGKAAEASAAWTRLLANPNAPLKLRTMAYREQAEMARRAGDAASQVRWLSELVTATGDSGARMDLAHLARDAGDNATFAAQLQAIVENAPASEVALQAIGELHAANIAVDPGDEGLAYYRHGQYEDAQRVLEAATSGDTSAVPPDELAFETFYLAASYEDGGRREDAVAAYDRVVAIDPASDFAHRAKYWAARVTETLGDPVGASARYVDLAVNGPPGEFTSEAAFRSGYTLFAAGDPAGAIQSWNSLGSVEDARLLYWKGRAYEQTGDSAGAAAAFEAAIAANSLDFYGQEAARRLGRQGPVNVGYQPLPPAEATDWAAIQAWLTEKVGGTPVTFAPTAAKDLLDLGLHDEAADELMNVPGLDDPWKLLATLKEADSLGLPDVTAQLAVKLRVAVGAQSDDVPRALLRLAYPLAYRNLLDQVARENDIDPLFLASLIRQESFWDANAGSHAGALGLTQVIPVTGSAIADALRYPGFRPEDLFRPAVSIRFGGYYIAGQLRRFGNPYAALAAYNAGPGNAERWSEAAPGSSPADFVEAVEISETNHYVVFVMEHYAHYVAAWRD